MDKPLTIDEMKKMIVEIQQETQQKEDKIIEATERRIRAEQNSAEESRKHTEELKRKNDIEEMRMNIETEKIIAINSQMERINVMIEENKMILNLLNRYMTDSVGIKVIELNSVFLKDMLFPTLLELTRLLDPNKSQEMRDKADKLQSEHEKTHSKLLEMMELALINKNSSKINITNAGVKRDNEIKVGGNMSTDDFQYIGGNKNE